MSLFDKDNQPLGEQAALERHIEQALAAEAPSGVQLEIFYRAIKTLFDPVILGEENLPDGPCLFVGNHSLFALDGWVLGPMLLRELDRFPRAMGDKFLFANPRVGDLILRTGGVMGHPDVCAALMEDGQDLLVFPGGAHEAVKAKRDIYELQWRERYGFVKLAARHGYTIMPFGMIGPDEFYGHLLEGEDLPDSPIGSLLKRLGVLNENTRRDMLPPIPAGALGTLFPKPQRCYIGFGEPVDLSAMQGKTPTKRQQQRIRSQVAEQIETQLAELLFVRAQNRGREGLLRRLLTI
ncbi:acyltransferase family protein [Pseudohalioglobus sediminis]|uniref:Acyltransferase family protein n=1 Tax=Pseudohalioglobus sediminis TaxID=2606449 RepID=A0A5B0WMX3_9GAMM|nr:lysophospholipid acyltransferase family protein [Pseudohalioglobus sediminis]KAA1188176.1 acyltransferase family protein [Pseudohalioglobus sediminis]